jgi:NRAMP (natural resistance-associated macrophage protein)-like metal ion transporter
VAAKVGQRTAGNEKPPPPTGSAEEIAREPSRLKRALLIAGPGLVTGAADDDPSGVATYAVAGASFGFSTLWMAIFCLPLMTAVQFISAKVGMASGTGLSGVLRERYPRLVVYPVVLSLLIANTINAGTDLGAIGAAVELFVPVPLVITVVIAAASIVLLQLFASYTFIASVFKWLTLALLAYVAAAAFVRPDGAAVLRGTLAPTFHADAKFIATLVALAGTTISPYLWFWQSSQEVDEERAQGRETRSERRGASRRELRYRALDVLLGGVASNGVMYFIILVTAATLHAHGKTDVNSAAQAAEALRPLAGDGAKYLFGIGLIGAGVLAVPILTGSIAYSVGEAFGWQASLNKQPHEAKRFYAVLVVCTVVGAAINFLGINPIDALFYTAVLNGLLAPPLLVLIMLMSRDGRVMAGRANGPLLAALGWATTVVMTLACAALLWTWVA